MKRAITCGLSGLLTVLTAQAPGVFAQNHPMPQYQVPSRPSRQNFGDEYKSQALREPVDCPELARYTGKQRMLNGTSAPRKEGGTSYVINYVTQEDPATVHNWYKNALAQNQWQIARESDYYIMAQHPKGHYLIVNTSAITIKGPDKCRYTLSFYQRSK